VVDAEPGIRLERVTKRFGDMTAVDALDLEVPRGAFYALLGPSGCGKTTTLRMVGGFEDPTDGRVFLGGDDVTERPPYKRDVNTVFQSYALFPHLSVEQNVSFGLERRKVGRDEVRQRVAETLDLVQLGSFGKRKPGQLSGGQAQRVALARALSTARARSCSTSRSARSTCACASSCRSSSSASSRTSASRSCT
jgi:spermidine/putrescine transport system ATP-binding protein